MAKANACHLNVWMKPCASSPPRSDQSAAQECGLAITSSSRWFYATFKTLLTFCGYAEVKGAEVWLKANSFLISSPAMKASEAQKAAASELDAETANLAEIRKLLASERREVRSTISSAGRRPRSIASTGSSRRPIQPRSNRPAPSSWATSWRYPSRSGCCPRWPGRWRSAGSMARRERPFAANSPLAFSLFAPLFGAR